MVAIVQSKPLRRLAICRVKDDIYKRSSCMKQVVLGMGEHFGDGGGGMYISPAS